MRRMIVRYATNEGGIAQQSVEALTRDEAIEKVAVPKGRVLAVNVDTFAGINDLLTNRRLNEAKQATVLSKLAARASAGGAGVVITKINELAQQSKDIGALVTDKFHKAVTIVEKLEALQFDPQAVTMVDIGEQTGDVGEAMHRASTYLIDRAERLAEIKNQTQQGMIYIILGIISVFALPMMFAGTLIELEEINPSGLDKNIGTQAILVINEIVRGWWFVIAGIFGALWYFKSSYWPTIRAWPVFQQFWVLQKMALGTGFVISFRQLVSIGMQNDAAVRRIAAAQKGGTAQLYANLITNLEDGKVMSEAFDRGEWPHSVVDGFEDFERVSSDARLKMLDIMQKDLAIQTKIAVKRVGRTSLLIGFGTVLAVLALIVMGGFIPIFTSVDIAL